jgi:hypothetical protein
MARLGLAVNQLQQLAGGEVADEAAIGGEKFVIRKLGELDPAHLLVDLVVDFAGEFAHREELQIDGAAAAIVMANARDGRSYFSADAQLFSQFPRERLLRALSGLDLSAGKLPKRTHRLIGTPLADQHFTVAHDERRRDEAQRGASAGAGSLGLWIVHVFQCKRRQRKAFAAGAAFAGSAAG